MNIIKSLGIVVGFLIAGSAVAEVEKIIVAPDQNEVVLNLTSNPSTGFSWQLKNYDEKLFAKVDHHFIPGEAPLGWVGVPGTEEWKFVLNPEIRKEQAGKSTRVVLQYLRPWKGGETGEEKIYELQL